MRATPTSAATPRAPRARRTRADLPAPARTKPEDPAPSLPLPDLAVAARSCRACPLYKGATQTVFGAGPSSAKIMVVGEQPGDEEDKSGTPFVGPAGRLLDQMFEAAGIGRSGVYVTNAVKHFKFVVQGKRRLHQKPKGPEIRACQPWLLAEIERLAPTVIIALGATAAAALFGSKVGVERDRGRPIDTPHARFGFVTYHPSAALRAPTAEGRARIRAALVDDLRAAATRVHEASCSAREQMSPRRPKRNAPRAG
jgi:uracil-DNA glycosylase